MNELTVIGILLGLSLGSFVNACVYRIPRNISMISARSFCPRCKKGLRWFELMPVLSFVLCRGRCRSCGQRISFLYPAIEIATAVVVVSAFWQNGISLKTVELITFFLLMLIVAAVDWKHFIIPNQVVIIGLIFGLALRGLSGKEELVEAAISSLASFLVLFVIMLFGNILFRRPSMGTGDLKLAAVIGLFLGFQDFLVALWLAAILGTILGMIKYLVEKKQTQTTPDFSRQMSPGVLPFGSFLAFVSIVVLIFEVQIQDFISVWLTSNL
jgi:leader peptidase (prepilin peptidase)/N-methyltransferase